MRALSSISLRAVLLAAIVAGAGVGAAGCGRTNEAGSARERDESRAYGRVTLRSEVAPRRVTLGDPVVWTLSATVPASVAIDSIRVDPAIGALDLVPRGTPSLRRSGATVTYRRDYDLRGFDLGVLPLPVATVSMMPPAGARAAGRDSLEFPADSLAVDSLTAASTGNLAPDRGPVDPGLRAIDYAVAGTIAALVLAAIVTIVVLLLRRRRKPEAAPVEVQEAPEIPFGRALDALRHEGPSLSRGAFHDRLSEAVRRYVAATTGVDAMDRTTRELERELKRSPRARTSAAGDVARILRRADLVKFAKREDGYGEAEALLEDAARLAGQVGVAPPAATATPASASATAPADSAASASDGGER